MAGVVSAHFRKVAERGGQALAEVEVMTAHPQNPRLLAYFSRASEGGGYSLVQVLANNADYELDWYDNSMHTAFEDISGNAIGTAEDQAELAAEILAYDGISDALDRHLNTEAK
ncbi:hypothetical protein [Cohnella kolymensis]|uniref:hypothetical protein n=1 Tax=Cohnella kolymensis TaxID=1590652 RepID=UPI000698505A|nr:hypothetical protein [Cohnella kolymensis]